MKQTCHLSRPVVIEAIRTHPDDPLISEFFYCVQCASIVAGGGFLPSMAQQERHQTHYLAKLPALDTLPGFSPAHTHHSNWVESHKAEMIPERYTQLKAVAATLTGSDNFVWVLRGQEQSEWQNHLQALLAVTADSWLAALNGVASPNFPNPPQLWLAGNPPQNLDFAWNEPE